MLGTPLVGAAVVWALAVFAGSRPAADGLDPIGFALLLCGPVAVLAAFLARSRWPRLAGLTSVAAVIGLALVVRALIG
jgi:protein-S-isoprenylcysteine O-methyltransferase Ste14